MTEHQTPQSVDREKANEAPSLDMIAKELLSNHEISKLPEEEQGRVIADRFVGAIVRNGEIQGSGDTYSPADVMYFMDLVSKEGADALDKVTRRGGLRDAVKALAGDIRVGKQFGKFESLLDTSYEGDKEVYTLSSAAQIEGYLLAGGPKNWTQDGVGGVHMPGADWIPVIMHEVDRTVRNPNSDFMTTRNARELTSSDLPSIKKIGRDWQMSMASAEKAGVDTSLIERSANKLKLRAKAGHDMGATALLVSTKGGVDRYEQSLKAVMYR